MHMYRIKAWTSLHDAAHCSISTGGHQYLIVVQHIQATLIVGDNKQNIVSAMFEFQRQNYLKFEVRKFLGVIPTRGKYI